MLFPSVSAIAAQATDIVDTVMQSTIPTGETSSSMAVPPPYQPTAVPDTKPSSVHLTNPPPPAKTKTSRVLAILTPKLTNKKHISTINGSITGSWTIDTSLVVPRFMRGSTAYSETPETRSNLRFGTINGAIKVKLTVLGEYDLDQRERISIVLGTTNGKIKCAIVRSVLPVSSCTSQKYSCHQLDRADKSLDLRVSSINGPIEVKLPVNFCGSVAFNSTRTPVTFSEDIQARLDTPLRNVLSGTGTIGPPISKNATDSVSCQFNDSFRFSTINGRVLVSFFEPGPSKEGFFSSGSKGVRGQKNTAS